MDCLEKVQFALDGCIANNSSKNIEKILEKYDKENARIVFEVALKRKILDAFCDQDNIFLESALALIDWTMQLHLNNDTFIEGILPLLLLEDTIDLIASDSLGDVVTFLQLHFTFLSHEFVPNKGKALVVLRMCNEMLRRLSKVTDSVLCGQIALILSSLIPMSDRSGVNMKGHLNVENVTKFEEGMQMDDLDTLYENFWSLQNLFYQPPASLTINIASLKKGIHDTLAYFESHSLTQKPSNASKFFYPKWLTGRKIFELQVNKLNDPLFRRQILIQYLFVVHYFQGLKQTIAIPDTVESWLNETRKQLIGMIEKTSQGKKVYSCIKRVLQSEKYWSDWKTKGCPSFEKSPLQLAFDLKPRQINFAEFRNSSLENIYSNKDPYQVLLKNAEKPPSLSTFLEPLEEDMNPEAAIEPYLRRSSDMIFVWKALKLTAKEDWTLLSRIGRHDVEKLFRLLKGEEIVDDDETEQHETESSVNANEKNTEKAIPLVANVIEKCENNEAEAPKSNPSQETEINMYQGPTDLDDEFPTAISSLVVQFPIQVVEEPDKDSIYDRIEDMDDESILELLHSKLGSPENQDNPFTPLPVFDPFIDLLSILDDGAGDSIVLANGLVSEKKKKRSNSGDTIEVPRKVAKV